MVPLCEHVLQLPCHLGRCLVMFNVAAGIIVAHCGAGFPVREMAMHTTRAGFPVGEMAITTLRTRYLLV